MLSLGLCLAAGAADAAGAVECPAGATLAREVIAAVNRYRAKPRVCGRERYRPAARLKWNRRLHAAAETHARDLARRRVLTHQGRSGSRPGDRIRKAGYAWRAYGENIAWGQPTLAEVLAGWLDSPEHCANLMSPKFTEIGVACVAPGGGRPFWVMDLAAPWPGPGN